jgi:hypothetical protein
VAFSPMLARNANCDNSTTSKYGKVIIDLNSAMTTAQKGKPPH